MSGPLNPPAFPSHVHPGTREGQEMCGMTLRDWFAGQALAGFCSLTDTDGQDVFMGAADTARAAYNYADSMLSARMLVEGGE